ncbi:MAG TPA: glutathione S-transferase N-terminal domain-containing protein [Gammaproteobacteria bacterium]
MGNRAYSSWSLRAWWTLKLANIDFDAVVVPLEGAGGSDERRRSKTLWQYSPSGKLPALQLGDLVIWDSLAIMEYAGERHAAVWPEGDDERAVARSVVAEIHGGFPGLGTQVVFNCRREPFQFPPNNESRRGIDRICGLWLDCRERFGADGKFLFGRATAADAASAPLVSIFHTYGFEVSPPVRAYMDAVLGHPMIEEWHAAARQEPWVIEAYESIGT